MYASTPKNTYAVKHRSDDLPCFTGGYTMCSAQTDESLDLPKSVYLTNGNFYEKKFSIRIDLPSKYIEIPLSMTQLSEWFSKIGVENRLEEQERLKEECKEDKKDWKRNAKTTKGRKQESV